MRIVHNGSSYWRFLILFILILGSTNQGVAQNFAENNWLFGNHQRHLHFLKGSAALEVLDTTGVSLGIKGAAVATDGRTGELLFFTDGSAIYDATYQPMAGLPALGGDTGANQGAVIVPSRNQDGFYLVIYRTTAGTLLYATVDMNQTGNGTPDFPMGFVVQVDQPLINVAVSTFTTVQGDEGGPYYLIYQEAGGNQDIVSRAVNPLQFPPLDAGTTTPLPISTFTANSFSYSQATGKLLVAPATPNTNLHLFDVDLASGTVSFDTVVLNSAFDDGANLNLYDAEISPSGRMVYVSRQGDGAGTGQIYQYDIDSGLARNPVMPVNSANSYGLKLGQDGNIYHLYQEVAAGPYLLGRITQVDSAIDQVGFEVVDLGIANYGAEQFPEISGTHDQNFTLSFATEDLCLGGTTKFFANVDPPPLSYFWSFDSTGSNTSTAVNPVVEFQNAGTFQVSLTVDVPGVGMQSVTQNVTIIDNQNQVTIGNDTTICPGDTLILMAEGDNIVPNSYFWSEIDTTTNTAFGGQTLEVTDAGDYWVRVDFTNGCEGYATINVSIYNEQEQTANFWHFGEFATVDFNEVPPVITSNQIMDAPEGCASISNTNGDALFYTDGYTVYNKVNEEMLLGDSIGGDVTSSQSSVITQFPGQTDELYYYIFTTTEMANGRHMMSYSVVDLKRDNALGGLIPQGTAIPLYTRATERLTLTEIDGVPTVITHEYGTNSFVGFQVTENGIFGPFFISGGSVHSRSSLESGEGYLKFNPSGDKLAVALKTPAANTVEVFDYIDSTQELVNALEITLPESPGTHSVYGLEYSNGGSKLFISVNGPDSRIYEVRIDSADQDFAQASLRQVNADGDGAGQSFGAIQFAPTGQILVAVDGATSLGTILAAEDTAQSAFILAGFSLATSDGSTVRSRLGLPNFAQSSISPITPPMMATTDGCLGNELTFMGSATSQLDTLTWYFGDGNTAIGDTVMHQYAQANDYFVTLQITNRCGLDTVLVDTVSIYAAIPSPTIPNSLPLCDDPITLDAADGIAESDWTYLWSTGETSQAISVNDVITAQMYTVTITDSVGCTSTDSTLVIDGRPQVDLGPNQAACEGDPIPDLNATNNGALFSWTLNGANTGNTTRLQPVNTNQTGTLEYAVQVNDTITGCVNADTVRFDITALPVLNTSTVGTSGCGNADGQASVLVTSPPNYGVTWTGPGSFVSNSEDTGPILVAGVYSVTVTDNVSGCAATEAVSISDGGADFSITNIVPADSCVNSSARLTVSLSAGTQVDYVVQNLTNGTSTGGDETVISGGFTLTSLTPGDYFVQVQSPVGCIQDTSFTIQQLPTATITTQDFVDACGNFTDISVDVSAVGNPQILWTAFNGGGFPVSEDITQADIRVDAAGLYLVTVTDLDDPNVCPATDSIQVNLNRFPGVTINIDGENCQGQLTLNLTTAPQGNYSSVWSLNGSEVAVGNSLVVTQSGRYDVRSTLQSTGCAATDFAAVVVTDPLEVQAVSEPACEDGNAVLLTAVATVGGDSLLYTWRGPGGISGTFIDNTVEVYEPGEYSVTVRRNLTPSDGCTASDRLVMERVPYDSIRLLDTAIICPQDPDINLTFVELVPEGDFITYFFNLPDSTTVQGMSYTAFEGGGIRVIGQDAFGCRDTAFVAVQEFCEVFVRAPTAFRPGSTISANAAYQVVYRNVEAGSFRAQIYNRWGEIIREFDTPDFAWDGTTAAGEPAPPGTYAVVFRYSNEYGDIVREFVERTRVTLLR